MKILISGISGKMGQLLKNDIDQSQSFEYAGGFDLIDAFDNQIDYDVLIDFSHVSQIKKVIDISVDNKKPVVLATTGLKEEDFHYINLKSREVAIFQSYNYSYGIQVLLKAINSILPMIDDYDIEITEKHHHFKEDAPSGTALLIFDEIKGHRKDAIANFGYQEKRKANEIGMHALRAGTIVGEHEVLLAFKDEMITIKHEALSKQIFTQGALRAAKYIKDKKSGLFHMKDLV